MEDLKEDAGNECEPLRPYLSTLGAIALSLGCAVGQGAFLMPGTTFLRYGGLLGTVIGMAVGALLMVLIGASYNYLLNRFPDAGGAFTYAKKTLGYDHAFLCAWFLLLAIVAVLWANTVAVPILLRHVIGDFLQFGWDYEIAGFTVHFGEVALCLAVLFLAYCLCVKKSFAAAFQIILAFGLCLAVAVAFYLVFEGREGGPFSLRPAFPEPWDWKQSALGVFNIVALAPWAYVGFESISNSAAEFRFDPRKTWRIFAIAVSLAALIYIALTLIAASALPEDCDNWYNYVTNLGNDEYRAAHYEGKPEALPTYFAMVSSIGGLGRALFVIAALCGVLTGIVGNFIAASRLLYALAADRLIPAWFGKLGRDHAPNHALLFVMAISLFVPFLGRTALAWIVDATTIAALIVFAYTSASAWLLAREAGKSRMAFVGWAGMTISLFFFVFFMCPKLLEFSTLGTESYFIIVLWSLLGFFFFRMRFLSDHTGRLGRSISVWVVLLGLIIFASVVWMYKATNLKVDDTVADIVAHYKGKLKQAGLERAYNIIQNGEGRIKDELEDVRNISTFNILVETVLICIALAIIFSIFKSMQNREKRLLLDKQMAEEVSRAKTNFLSNMSHEIRTPMNAIIGLDNIALRDPEVPAKTRGQLEKIGSSARHLLGLINDILDMSRIESGRLVLKDDEFAFREFLEQINVIVQGQCSDKGLTYLPDAKGAFDDYYVGDDMKLKQVLINVLGNAVKFTPAPGSVAFTAEETARYEGYRTLTFTIQDTGIGMDKDFIPKIFEPFSQEDAAHNNRYGGSGLGMSITNSLVQMMGGDIKIESVKGKGTTFTIKVTLKACSRSVLAKGADASLSHLRVLVVDDDPVAVDHAKLELATLGIHAESCGSAPEALMLLRDRRVAGKPFHFLLTDLKMPSMDGVELTRQIRAFDGGDTAVVIMTGYDFDAHSEPAKQARVDGFIYKPLFSNSLKREFVSIMRKRALEVTAEVEPSAPAASPLEGRNVLVAEDVDLNAEILADLLEIEGVKAERAENGAVAVQMFSASKPGHYDAVLMDIRMPEMDGLAATRAIRALDRPDAKAVPIVAMTANAFEDDVQRSLQAGLNAHLAKPVEPERLYEVLRLLIARRGDKE